MSLLAKLSIPYFMMLLVYYGVPLRAETMWRVGAASVAMQAEDSMVIGGGIGPGFVQGQEGLLQVPVAFFSGAAGSTHNLGLPCDEMVTRIKSAFEETLLKASPMQSTQLASIKRELAFQMRTFDELAEDQAVSEYCRKYASQGTYRVEKGSRMAAIKRGRVCTAFQKLGPAKQWLKSA